MRWLLLVAGCATTDPPSGVSTPVGGTTPSNTMQGVQIGEEGDDPICEEVTSPIDDPSVPSRAMSLSAEAARLMLEEHTRGTVAWADGGTDPLQLSVWTGEVVLVEEVALEGIDPALCSDQRYRFEVEVDIRAGALEASVIGDAYVSHAEAAWWDGHQDADELSLGHDLNDWPEVDLVVSASRRDAGWAGPLSWWARDGSAEQSQALGTFTMP